MSPITPTIDDLIRTYFAARVTEVTGIRQRRIAQLEPLLRRCLDAEAERIAPADRRTLFEAEKEFDPVGAFARTMTATELLRVFPPFLRQPWLLQHPLEQGEQLGAVVAMSRLMIVTGAVDTAVSRETIREIEDAVHAAKLALAALRLEAQRARRAAKIAKVAREARELASWLAPGGILPEEYPGVDPRAAPGAPPGGKS